MDLFEIVEKRAGEIIDEIEERYGNPPYDPATDAISGIEAMTKALREMIVGEPVIGDIEHRFDYTWVKSKERDLFRGRIDGLHGTQGEEVAVLVLRYDKQKEQKEEPNG